MSEVLKKSPGLDHESTTHAERLGMGSTRRPKPNLRAVDSPSRASECQLCLKRLMTVLLRFYPLTDSISFTAWRLGLPPTTIPEYRVRSTSPRRWVYLNLAGLTIGDHRLCNTRRPFHSRANPPRLVPNSQSLPCLTVDLQAVKSCTSS